MYCTKRLLIQLNEPAGGRMTSQPLSSSRSTWTRSPCRSKLVGYRPFDVLGPHHTSACGTVTMRTSGTGSPAHRAGNEPKVEATAIQKANTEAERMSVLPGRRLPPPCAVVPFLSRRELWPSMKRIRKGRAAYCSRAWDFARWIAYNEGNGESKANSSLVRHTDPA